MSSSNFYKLLSGVAITTMMGLGAVSSEYMDMSGSSNKLEKGRTKNGLAAVISGIIGQKISDNSTIDFEIEKNLWPDARVTGRTTPTSINTSIDLVLTSAQFTAQTNNPNKLEGTVDKSEFDWDIKQTNENTYNIGRFGPKLDSKLSLTVANGQIAGTYIRNGLHFDWDIQGTYDENGNVIVEIDGPLNLGITLNGKITKQ